VGFLRGILALRGAPAGRVAQRARVADQLDPPLFAAGQPLERRGQHSVLAIEQVADTGVVAAHRAQP
jgi:hypothetical protein